MGSLGSSARPPTSENILVGNEMYQRGPKLEVNEKYKKNLASDPPPPRCGIPPLFSMPSTGPLVQCQCQCHRRLVCEGERAPRRGPSIRPWTPKLEGVTPIWAAEDNPGMSASKHA